MAVTYRRAAGQQACSRSLVADAAIGVDMTIAAALTRRIRIRSTSRELPLPVSTCSTHASSAIDSWAFTVVATLLLLLGKPGASFCLHPLSRRTRTRRHSQPAVLLSLLPQRMEASPPTSSCPRSS